MSANAYRGFLALAGLVVLAAAAMEWAGPEPAPGRVYWMAEGVLFLGGMAMALIALAWGMIAPRDPDFERARAAGEVYVDPWGEWWEFVLSNDGYDRMSRMLAVFIVMFGVSFSSLVILVLRHALG